MKKGVDERSESGGFARVVIIGQIGAPYGLKGWLKLHSFTEPAENIFTYPHWLIENKSGWEPIKVEATKADRTPMLVKFQGCENPEQARLYTLSNIGTTRDQLPPTTGNDFYWTDLEGLQVINTKNEHLGTVDYVTCTGANDILVVNGDRERWIPYIPNVIIKVDLDAQTILVHWDLDF